MGKVAAKEPDYLKWMIDGEFPVDTRMVAKRIYMNGVWEKQLTDWLKAQKISGNTALCTALYATLKFGQDLFPFSTHTEGGKLTLTYLTEPPATYSFIHKDAQALLLQLLEKTIDITA
jgi:DNA polymerase-3 subunit epsilon